MEMDSFSSFDVVPNYQNRVLVDNFTDLNRIFEKVASLNFKKAPSMTFPTLCCYS